ncbi:MAG: hypothetical protein LBJ44_01875 [Propionibacteriaceae bacterium]|nr:hypothetical protein [Propionibacteriaceae bacterium]
MSGFSAEELRQLRNAGAAVNDDLQVLRRELDHQGAMLWDYLKNFAFNAQQVGWQPVTLRMSLGAEWTEGFIGSKNLRNGQDRIGLATPDARGEVVLAGWMICFPSRAVDFQDGWAFSGIGQASVPFRGPFVAPQLLNAEPEVYRNLGVGNVARFERVFVLADGSIPQAAFLTEAFTKQLLLKSLHAYLDGSNPSTTDEYLRFSLGLIPQPNTANMGGRLPKLEVTGERAAAVIKEFFRQTLATRGQYGHVSYAYMNQGVWQWDPQAAGWHHLPGMDRVLA